MNVIQKSESIKNGLRKGFQDGSSKMARRKCYGYKVGSDGELTLDPEEAKVVSWIFEQFLLVTVWGKLLPSWKSRVFLPPLAGPNGIGKRSTNCSPMKNILGECCSRKRSAPALSRSKTMASWNGISIPALIRPLFLTRCLWRYSRRNSADPKNHRNRLP